jgi:hypothetical protein
VRVAAPRRPVIISGGWWSAERNSHPQPVVIEPVDGANGAGPFQVGLPRCPDQPIARRCSVVGRGSRPRWTVPVRTAVDLARRARGTMPSSRSTGWSSPAWWAWARCVPRLLPCRGAGAAGWLRRWRPWRTDEPRPRRATRVRLPLHAGDLPMPVAQSDVRDRGGRAAPGRLRLGRPAARAGVRRDVARRAGPVPTGPAASQPADGGRVAGALRHRCGPAPARAADRPRPQ